MKTPVLRPAIESVLFGFERIGMVIRVAWLPLVVAIGLYVVSFGLLVGFADVQGWKIETDGFDELFATVVGSAGLVTFFVLQSTILPLIVSLVLSCVYVAVTRASTVADYEPPSMPFYFALGARELRYFAARLLYGIIISIAGAIFLGLGFVAVAAGIAGAEALNGYAKALTIAPAAALALAAFFLWLWVSLRFIPVLPIAAVENRIDFGAAWNMTKGNFWRLAVSGLFFLTLLEGMVWALLFLFFLPALIVLALIGGLLFSVAGPAGFLIIGLIVVVLLPAVIAIAAFTLAAEAAYPARLYAYLTDCGDRCKIY
ncbi:MAG: hypothetical protein AAGD92_07790 [Pseudomonadota bacterium]